MKRGLMIGAGLACVVLVALLALPSLLDVNHYKTTMMHQVEDSTGHVLNVGDMKLSVLPRIELQLADVRLMGAGDYEQDVLLSVQELDVQVGLFALLSGQLDVKRLRLKQPLLNVVQTADGSGNWADLVGERQRYDVVVAGDATAQQDVSIVSESATESEAAPATSGFGAWMAERVGIDGGELKWTNEALGQSWHASDIYLQVDDVLSSSQAMNGELGFHLNGSQWKLQGKLAAMEDPAHVDLKALPLQAELSVEDISSAMLLDVLRMLQIETDMDVAGLPARVDVQARLEQRDKGIRLSTGTIAWDTQALNWSLNMPSASMLKVDDIAWNIAGKNILHMRGQAMLEPELQYDLRMESTPLQYAWLASVSPLWESLYAKHDKPWERLSFGGEIAGDAHHLKVKNFQWLLNDETLYTSADVNWETDVDVRMQFQAQTLHLDSWLPRAAEGVASAASSDISTAAIALPRQVTPGDVTAQVATTQVAMLEVAKEPDLRMLKDWRVHVRGKIDQLAYQSLDLKQLRLAMDAARGEWNMTSLAFEMGAGHADMQVSMDVNHYPVRWSHQIQATALPIAPFLDVLGNVSLVTGEASLEASGHARGLLKENMFSSLVADSQIDIRDGKVLGIDMVKELQQLLVNKESSDDDRTSFTTLSGHFKARAGVVRTSDLFLSSPNLRVTGDGKITLADQTMDFVLKPRLVGSLFGQGDTIQVRKGLSIPLRVKGPLSNPKVSPTMDPATLIENVGGVVGGGVLGVGDAIRGLGGLLGGDDAKE